MIANYENELLVHDRAICDIRIINIIRTAVTKAFRLVQFAAANVQARRTENRVDYRQSDSFFHFTFFYSPCFLRIQCIIST